MDAEELFRGSKRRLFGLGIGLAIILFFVWRAHHNATAEGQLSRDLSIQRRKMIFIQVVQQGQEMSNDPALAAVLDRVVVENKLADAQQVYNIMETGANMGWGGSKGEWIVSPIRLRMAAAYSDSVRHASVGAGATSSGQ